MKYLHAMVRVKDLPASMKFYRDTLGLIETRRHEVEAGRFTLVYLAVDSHSPEIELTHNWDNKDTYTSGRNFGHLAFEVDNIYETCDRFLKDGITILRPPRDGRMAFIRSPDQISIELLQKDSALPPKEPGTSMTNSGEW